MKPALTNRLQTTVLRHLGEPVVVAGEHCVGALDDRYQVRVINGQPTEVQEPVLWIQDPRPIAALRQAHRNQSIQIAGREYVVVGIESSQGDGMVGLRLKQSQG